MHSPEWRYYPRARKTTSVLAALNSIKKEAIVFTLKEMIKDNRRVTFVRYKEGELWYATEDGFEFPVPIDDVGSATMLSTDKALLFMRYIRKHLALLDKARAQGSLEFASGH